jgi:hypothetical protein
MSSTTQSFEQRFFGQVLVVAGKANNKRECKYCGALVSDQNERRRNHLKGAAPGSVCATKFAEGNHGLSFKDFVLTTQPQDVITKLYPGFAAVLVGSDRVLSPVSTTGSARVSTPGGGGGGPGGSGVGFDFAGHLGMPSDPLPLGSPSAPGPWTDSMAPPATPSPSHIQPTDGARGHRGAASGVPASASILRHYRAAPNSGERHRFKRLLTRVMAACAYSASSLQHPVWKELVGFLWPGMEGEIPCANTLL